MTIFTYDDLMALDAGLRSAHGEALLDPETHRLCNLLEKTIVAIFDLFPDAPKLPRESPLQPVACQGLLGSLAPPGSCASGVLKIYTWLDSDLPGGIAADLETIVVDAGGNVWSSAFPTGPITMEDLSPTSALLAALLHRRLGIACPPPASSLPGPGWASDWASALHLRASRNGHRLGLEEAQVLDPLNDPVSDAALALSPSDRFEKLLAGEREWVIGKPASNWKCLYLSEFAEWLDVGSFAWLTQMSAPNYIELMVSLGYCLQPDAFISVVNTMSQRNWLPVPADPPTQAIFEALHCNEAGLLSLNATFMPHPMTTLQEPDLVGALAMFSEHTADWEQSTPTTAPGAYEIVGAVAWKKGTHLLPPNAHVPLGSGDSAPNPALPPYPLIRPSPLEVVALDSPAMEMSLPFAGLAKWKVPDAADGIVLTCYSRSHPAVIARRKSTYAEDSDDPLAPLAQMRPPGPLSATDLITVAVNRKGEAGCGIFEADPPAGSVSDSTAAALTNSPRSLYVYRLTDPAQLIGEPVARFAFALARKLLGLSVPEPPSTNTIINRWLAARWAYDLAVLATGIEQSIEPQIAFEIDPHASPLTQLCQLPWEEVPKTLQALTIIDDEQVSGISELSQLAEAFGPDLLGWAIAAITPPRDLIQEMVRLACTPYAADLVINNMALRSSFELLH